MRQRLLTYLRSKWNRPGGGSDPSSQGSAIIDYLVSKLPAELPDLGIGENVNYFKSLSVRKQQHYLITTYFLLEHFICEVDHPGRQTKVALREELAKQFGSVHQIPYFRLVFQSAEMQEMRLGQEFLVGVLNRSQRFLGSFNKNRLPRARAAIELIPDLNIQDFPVEFPLDKQPETPKEWSKFLISGSKALFAMLEDTLGYVKVKSIYEASYDEMAGFYTGLDSFAFTIDLIPDKILDQHKINILSRKRMQEVLQQQLNDLHRTNTELRDKNIELERIRRELVEANHRTEKMARIKEQFLANMSHEIRTPINAVIGFQYLLGQSELSEKQRDLLKGIEINSDNLLLLVNDIMDLSKIEAGKVQLAATPFDLQLLLRKLNSSVGQQAFKKQLDFSVVIQENVNRHLIGDPHRLNQVLVNLVGNALKFTSEGFVHLKVSVEDKQNDRVTLLFVVKDSGIGIEPEQRDRIFENFTQVSADTTREYGGTGLGLPISKQLVTAMKGTIALKTELDKGSEFSVRIPFRLDPEQGASLRLSKIEKKEQTKVENLSILVAEDNQFNQMILKEVLRQWDLCETATMAGNGLEALNAMKEKHYDIVLMDVQMPEMDGLTATREIRQLPDRLKASVPILGITAHAFTHELQKCFDAGMNDCLTKPLQTPKLKDRIVQLCSQDVNPVRAV